MPQLIPTGLTLLAGRPKSGKSWLGLQIARAVGAGEEILGQPVERRRVLYLALEDNARRLKERMERQGWPAGLDVDFLLASDFRKQVGSLALKGKYATAGAQRLAKYIEAMAYRLIVTDTLSRAGLGDQLAHDEMVTALEPLQELALSLDCAFIFLDHHHKAVGDTPDAVSHVLGSTAKGALADTLLALYRKPGEVEAKLCATGRDIRDIALQLCFDDMTGCWRLLGKATTIELTERRQEILDVLATLGTATLSDIAKSIGQDKSNTSKRLADLVAAGLVRRTSHLGIVAYELGDAFDEAMAS
nr:AAA family ATPase [Chloroflexota bacterium]